MLREFSILTWEEWYAVFEYSKLLIGKEHALCSVFQRLNPDDTFKVALYYYWGNNEDPLMFIKRDDKDYLLLFRTVKEVSLSKDNWLFLYSKHKDFFCSPWHEIDFNNMNILIAKTNGFDSEMFLERLFTPCMLSSYNIIHDKQLEKIMHESQHDYLKFMRLACEASYLKFSAINHKYDIKDERYVKKNGRRLAYLDEQIFFNNSAAHLLWSILQDLIRQVAQIMKEIHNYDLVFGDLKKENVIVSVEKNGKISVKLTDLGSVTKEGSALDCVGWFSPEYASLLNCTQKDFIRMYSDYTKVMEEVVFIANKPHDIYNLGQLIFELFVSETLNEEYNIKMICSHDNANLFNTRLASELEKIDELDNRIFLLFDLIIKCTLTDTLERLTIEEVLMHPFFDIKDFVYNCKVKKWNTYNFFEELYKNRFNRSFPIYIDERKVNYIEDNMKRKRIDELDNERIVKRQKITSFDFLIPKEFDTDIDFCNFDYENIFN